MAITKIIKPAIITFILILVCSFNGASQNIHTYGHADHVISGEYHLKMDSTQPQLIAKNTNSMYITNNYDRTGNYGTYSDKQGNLKLFSNACHIYDGNYQPVNTNPFSFCNDSFAVDYLNLIVPMPGNPDLLYVFCLTSYENSSQYPGKFKDTLFYSMVDISGSNPQIITTQQFTDVPLEEEDLMTTKHTNGRDYWLISQRHFSNTFLAFHLKPGGQVDTVYSQAGMANTSPNDFHDYDKLSPNGRILASSVSKFSDTLQLLHFNAQTGMVSDSNIRYIINFGSGLMIENIGFSSNSRYLYVIHQSYYPRFFQYDLHSPTQQALMNSKTEIFNNNSQWIQEDMPMLLAANRKVYTFAADSVMHIQEPLYLNSIEYPNKPDTNCSFKPESFLVDSNLYDQYATNWPIFVSSWLQEPVEISYTHTCLGSDVGGVTHFSFTDSVYKATWHFGDTVTAGPDTSSQLYPSHQYLAPGKYTVWAKALHYGMWDSVSKTITIHQNPQISLGPDTMITPNDTLVLDPGPGYADYKWNFGDTTQTYTVYGSQLNPGVSYHYSVDVTDTNGCSGKAGTDVYCSGVGLEEKAKDQWKVYPNPTENRLTIELPQALHKETQLKLYGPNGALLRQYTWPEQSKTHKISLTGLSEGVYGLELETENYTLKKKVVKR